MKTTLEPMAQPFLIRIIEEDQEAIAGKLNNIWNSKKDSITLDGFRRGKVPQNIAEKTYGFQTLYKDYIDEVITSAISRVNAENQVTVVDLQQVVPEKLDKQGIVMQAVAYLKPKVLDLDYSNLKATKLDSTVSDEEYNMQVEQYQEQNALIRPISDRGVQFGDIIVVSYVGSLNGVPFQGGTATRQQLTLTDNAFIPGFGEALLGMTTDQNKTFSVTFPADYHAQNLAGKESSFDITVHEIKVKKLPELDNDLAVTCGFTSLDDLKQKVREGLASRKQEYNRSRTETEICLELVRTAQIAPIPQTMVQKRLTNILQQELNKYGASEAEYYKQNNIDRNTFDRMFYQNAVRDLKIQLILDHVAESEKLDVSQEERDVYAKGESDRLGYTMEQIKDMATPEQLDSQVKLRKAYDVLLTKVTYVEENVGPKTEPTT